MLLKHVEKKKVEMNIIPMVDIVFQLIIFFLVAMQVKENKIVQLSLPRARHGDDQEEKGETALVINIVSPDRAKGRPYNIQGKYYDSDGLRAKLQVEWQKAQAQRREMPTVRVRADMNSEFEAIQKALLHCRDAHIWKVRLTTKKPV